MDTDIITLPGNNPDRKIKSVKKNDRRKSIKKQVKQINVIRPAITVAKEALQKLFHLIKFSSNSKLKLKALELEE